MFPKILRNLRKEKNISQEKLGSVFNVSKQAISSWETGRSEPDSFTYKKIAEYFDVSVDYLLGKDNIPNKENLELHKELVKLGLIKDGEELSGKQKDALIKFIHAINELKSSMKDEF